jgi:carboxyl-terminal processing protease
VPEEILKIHQQTPEVEQSAFLVEVDEKIDVTGVGGVTASDRSEDSDSTRTPCARRFEDLAAALPQISQHRHAHGGQDTTIREHGGGLCCVFRADASFGSSERRYEVARPGGDTGLVESLFASGPIWVVVPGVPEGDDTRELLELESAEIEVELGGPVVVASDPPSGANVLVLEVDAACSTPTLAREGSRVVARGSSLGECELAVSLLRTMRRIGGSDVAWAPTPTLDDAIERVDAEIATTWPSFERAGIDWASTRASCEPIGTVADMQRWVAQLGDGHTNVHLRSDLVALPYAAKVIDDALVLMDVPEQTAAWHGGVRAGDQLVDVDILEIVERAGAPAHMKPWLIGRRALSGPAGQPYRGRARRSDGSIRTWEEKPGPGTWPNPIEFRRLPTGTAYLRIRRWHRDDEAVLDRVLGQLDSKDRLLVDLRGNAGGSLVAAVAFRRRFIDEPTRTGAVRFSRGDGTLTAPSFYDDTPSERTRWLGRTRLLTDALTYSASEDAILGLDQHPQIDIAGQPSGGGSGRPRRLPLHNTSVLTVSSALTYDHVGHCIEGNGVPVTRQLDDDTLTPTGADCDW